MFREKLLLDKCCVSRVFLALFIGTVLFGNFSSAMQPENAARPLSSRRGVSTPNLSLAHQIRDPLDNNASDSESDDSQPPVRPSGRPQPFYDSTNPSALNSIFETHSGDPSSTSDADSASSISPESVDSEEDEDDDSIFAIAANESCLQQVAKRVRANLRSAENNVRKIRKLEYQGTIYLDATFKAYSERNNQIFSEMNKLLTQTALDPIAPEWAESLAQQIFQIAHHSLRFVTDVRERKNETRRLLLAEGIQIDLKPENLDSLEKRIETMFFRGREFLSELKKNGCNKVEDFSIVDDALTSFFFSHSFAHSSRAAQASAAPESAVPTQIRKKVNASAHDASYFSHLKDSRIDQSFTRWTYPTVANGRCGWHALQVSSQGLNGFSIFEEAVQSIATELRIGSDSHGAVAVGSAPLATDSYAVVEAVSAFSEEQAPEQPSSNYRTLNRKQKLFIEAAWEIEHADQEPSISQPAIFGRSTRQTLSA